MGRVPGARAAVREVLEVSVPVEFFESLRWSPPPFAIEFHVVLGKAGLELERFPWDSVLSMEFDPEAFELTNWFV